MIEDEHYRTSSQYRYWSYTPSQLAQLRQMTNELASKRVRQAKGDASIATLTVREEVAIINWGCAKIREIGSALAPAAIPHEIQCTAIQYLRRFYLSNSAMTYHPRTIMLCALYLATKASHWHVGIGRYIAELEGVADTDVTGMEFLLLQGLRFTLDVRHPVKGLEAAQLEMSQMARERRLPATFSERRVGELVKQAREVLRGPAQMTDVYFGYTPAQIWLAAVWVVDEELATRYIEVKAGENENVALIKDKLMSTVASCAEMIDAYTAPENDPGFAKEMKRIGKKLHLCQNPETVEGKVKREGEDSEREEKKAKKRKLEKEMREKDAEVFGGDLRNMKQ